MSSVNRLRAVNKEGLTKFVKCETPSYDSGSYDSPFPFSYSRQVLDISYEGNNFKSVMVNQTGIPPAGSSNTSIRMLGGTYLATSLGPNFKAYIRAWRTGIDANSPIEVYTPPQLIRVQQADRNYVYSSSDVVWRETTNPPTSEDYITGNTSDNYGTTYIFKTPLTFTIVEGGVKKYITFKTKLDQE